ncbi:MAG: hypothetical protein WAV55_10865 [Clostridiaceae bacterium]
MENKTPLVFSLEIDPKQFFLEVVRSYIITSGFIPSDPPVLGPGVPIE